MLDLGIFQEQKLKLAMTTEMKQAISILQFSSLELAEFVKNEALDNPLIELEEPQLQMEGRNYSHKKSSVGGSSYQSPLDFFRSKEGDSLHDSLISQVSFLSLSKQEKYIVDYLILTLDENGYLAEEPLDSASHLRVSLQDVQHAIKIIQQLEPIGVGASNLKECLSIQIDYYYPNHKDAQNVVLYYLTELSMRNWKLIAKELHISLNRVKEIFEIIQTLNPKPGSLFDNHIKTNYIIPDLHIQILNNKLTIQVNDKVMPKISVASDYEPMLHTFSNKQNPTAKYLKNKYKHVMWLNKSIEHRRITLFNVMKAITYKQMDFFQKGPSHLNPLTLKEIAKICDVHESTVSRATNNKYVQTPFGVYELKHFFSSAIQLSNGLTTSSYTIKHIMKELIEREDPTKPMSDQKLTVLLRDRNILVSRRTVAKYREQLGIPSSTNRRRSISY
ncbi:RNA polymerase factor sigma-54 [Radiobacillus kanasensis]|uniref:RNA polymerase factor sigma-54 n=1 Tax=Radiobacillus kanasensis TaxID=2844358 RepID=UPI001E450AC0|nr:RNA polymerase factor sigma-54 [Radiobacillus kanasensis]UFT98830.1 RNA polymerase factor sigma-54 [Radiobacillus kanasensis]